MASLGYVVLGHALLTLGVVALLVPIVPTTPFLVLAAMSYARGSPRFHDWLVNHRWFGPPIRAVRDGRGITRRAKLLSVAASLVGFLSAVTFFARSPWARAVSFAITGLFVYGVLRLPTDPDRSADAPASRGGNAR